MKKKCYSDEKIVSILREADASTVASAAKKHAVTERTIYRWVRYPLSLTLYVVVACAKRGYRSIRSSTGK